MLKSVIISLIFMVLLNSCSLNSFVVGQMAPVFKVSSEALYEETDLELAEQAIAANLKLLEGLLKNDPQNEELLLLLAQGYAGYALGFIEDKDPKRAGRFYDRAFQFAQRALFETKHDFNWNKQNRILLEEHVAKINEKSATPALFWTAFAIAGKINVSLDDPTVMINQPVLLKMIERLEAVNPEYFFGAVYLMRGAILGITPKMLGGNPEKAAEYFDKSIALTNSNFLLAHIYKARFYAVKTLNEEAFDSLMQHVTSYNLGTKKELGLFNSIAKQKAKLLLENRDELF